MFYTPQGGVILDQWLLEQFRKVTCLRNVITKYSARWPKSSGAWGEGSPRTLACDAVKWSRAFGKISDLLYCKSKTDLQIRKRYFLQSGSFTPPKWLVHSSKIDGFPYVFKLLSKPRRVCSLEIWVRRPGKLPRMTHGRILSKYPYMISIYHASECRLTGLHLYVRFYWPRQDGWNYVNGLWLVDGGWELLLNRRLEPYSTHEQQATQVVWTYFHRQLQARGDWGLMMVARIFISFLFIEVSCGRWTTCKSS